MIDLTRIAGIEKNIGTVFRVYLPGNDSKSAPQAHLDNNLKYVAGYRYKQGKLLESQWVPVARDVHLSCVRLSNYCRRRPQETLASHEREQMGNSKIMEKC